MNLIIKSLFSLLLILNLYSFVYSGDPLNFSHFYYPAEKALGISTQYKKCNTPDAVLKEIAGYKVVFKKMMDKVLSGDFKNLTWSEINDYSYKHPKRMSGTPQLEKAIDHLEDLMKNKFKFDEVNTQNVEVPHWERGKECAKLLKPYEKEIAIFGLGTSIATPPEGIIAEGIVVKDFDELEKVKDKVKGKIVIVDFDYNGYGVSAKFRTGAAAAASKHGAVATLIRSVSNYSLYSPHTGANKYGDAKIKIPTASIAIEDAFLFSEMQKRGDKIEIKLKMEAKNLPMKTSRNVFGQITGREDDKKYVVLSGHIDGWDSGMGAFDDAGGVLLGVLSLHLMKALDLKPRRTIKAVAWTAEEVGYYGINAFIENNSQDDLKNIVAAFECDEGIFKPDGMDFAGNDEAFCIVKEIVKILEPIGAGLARQFLHVSSDISKLKDCCDTPGFSVHSRGLENEYFNYHHTKADHPVWIGKNNVDLSMLAYAFVGYVMADLSVELPTGSGEGGVEAPGPLPNGNVKPPAGNKNPDDDNRLKKKNFDYKEA